MMSNQTLVERFRGARGDPSLAVLEGFHPLKHAIRFGAQLIEVVSLNVQELSALGEHFAPDIAFDFDKHVSVVPEDVFEQLAPIPPPTGVIAIAERPTVSLIDLLNSPTPAPVVLLENPRNLLNIGAAVRVSAAAGCCGSHNHWSPGPLEPSSPYSWHWFAVRATCCADRNSSCL